ncbi:Carboxylesterase 5A [Linnemannia hyalina]|uniref:Carboxylesterase 5A n=1 Tax=Linnemannia hyalina TaxID=64524 RepID=A0A9P7Y379_9FUNG|nr:Carboxylesterase 5A [Linnemannia hyalina]
MTMAHNQDAGPVVLIPNLGSVRGVFNKDMGNKVAKFLNVPFAVVEERWRPATKVQAWDGVRDATKLGPMPPQQTENNAFLSMFLGVPEKFVYDEDMSERDCLNCNIFMPASAVGSSEELPVLVWIHGGGMQCSDLVLESINQDKPMIVVTLNYRLNYFGFLSSKELLLDAQQHAKTIPDNQWYDGSVGNWGILDQILGLEWIRDHIGAFSGNPSRVTIMGESGGSIAVSYLHLIPQARGLFRRSILQSGAASTMPEMYPEQEGQVMFDRLCKLCEIPEDLEPLEKVARLRRVRGEKFVEDMNATPFILFRPSLDGVVFRKDCRMTVGDAESYDPQLEWVMTGNTRDEGASTLEEQDPLISRLCPLSSRPQFTTIFGTPSTDTEVQHLSMRLTGDGGYRFPTLQISEAIKAHPTAQLTRYHFDRHTEKLEGMMPGMGAHHGVDLFFVFGNATARGLLNKEEKGFVKKVQAVWIEFVTAASPMASTLPKVLGSLHPTTSSGEGVGAGEEAVVAEKEAIVFGDDLKVTRGAVERLSAEEIAFWWKSYAYAAEQAKLGRAGEVGFNLAKGIKP